MKWRMERIQVSSHRRRTCLPECSCGVCAIAAFSDDDMNDLLELDGVERFVMYIAAMGKK